MPFSIWNTYYLAGLADELPPVQTFFRDRYFPTGAGDIFNADKVIIEYRDGDRRLAPFVVRRAGDIPIAREGFEVREYEPPYIAPSRLLSLDDLAKRGFGEALYVGRTPEERAIALTMDDLADLDKRISRREEWMASQTMQLNGCVMTAYIDNDTVGETFDLFFYDTDGSNPALFTVANKWDAGGDFWADIEEMCTLLADRGLPVSELVVGSDVGDVLQNDDKVQKYLDNRRMEYGVLRPEIRYPGVVWLGQLNFGGFLLDIFVVRETYVDESGTSQRIFPSTMALVTAPGCGHTMYGAVSQMEPDKEFHTFAMRRVPKFTADEEHDIRKLRLAARPLTAPLSKAPWITAPNVVGP